MMLFIKYFFSKCDQIHRKRRIWTHLLKKSLMENIIFCAVKSACTMSSYFIKGLWNVSPFKISILIEKKKSKIEKLIDICDTRIKSFNVYPRQLLWLWVPKTLSHLKVKFSRKFFLKRKLTFTFLCIFAQIKPFQIQYFN